MPSRPSEAREAPPPARSEQNTKEKFCFPFRRKNRARANPKIRQNFSLVWRVVASGGGAERQFRSKKVRLPASGGNHILILLALPRALA